MILRSIMLSLALCAIVVARVVCPCPAASVTTAEPVKALEASPHACCHKSQPSDEQPVKPCDKHEQTCPHCGAQLAPSEKTVETNQFALAPALINTLLSPAPSASISLSRPELRLIDPSPPSLLDLHCLLVI